MATGESVIVQLKLLGAASMSRDAKAAAGALQGIGTAASRAEARGLTRLNRMSRNLGSGLATLQHHARTAAIGIGTVGAAATGFIARAGFGMNQTIDRQRVSFETFTGSAKKAAWIMGQVQKIAKDSPALSVDTAGAGVQSLMAYGMSAEKAIKLTRILSDQAAASGKDIDQSMSLGALALGQIAAKGKLSAEELGQLTEGVALNRNLVAKNLGMSGAEFAKQMAAGKIAAVDAIPAIEKAMQQQSRGGQARLARTTEGQFGKLQDVWSQAAGKLTKPFYDAAGRLAGRLADRLGNVKWENLGKQAFAYFDNLGKQAFAYFDKAVQFIQGIDFGSIIDTVTRFGRIAIDAGRDLLDAFRPAMPFIRNVLMPLLKGIGESVLELVVVGFKIAVPVIRVFSTALVVGFKIAVSVIRVFSTALGWIGKKMEPLRPLMEVVGRLIGFLFPGSVLKAVGLFAKGITGAGGAIRAFGRVGALGVKAVMGPVNRMMKVANAIGRPFKAAGAVIARVFGWAWRTIRPIVTRVESALKKVSQLAAALNPAEWGNGDPSGSKSLIPYQAAGTGPLGIRQGGTNVAVRAPRRAHPTLNVPPGRKHNQELPVHTTVVIGQEPAVRAVTKGVRMKEAVR